VLCLSRGSVCCAVAVFHLHSLSLPRSGLFFRAVRAQIAGRPTNLTRGGDRETHNFLIVGTEIYVISATADDVVLFTPSQTNQRTNNINLHLTVTSTVTVTSRNDLSLLRLFSRIRSTPPPPRNISPQRRRRSYRHLPQEHPQEKVSEITTSKDSTASRHVERCDATRHYGRICSSCQ
jgi:hypothetical protein